MRGGLRLHPLPVDQPEPIGRLPAEEDILGDGQRRHDRQFLVDHADAARLRLGRSVEPYGLTAKDEDAIVRRVHAGKDLHQRALASAVLPDETVNLAGQEIEVDLGQRDRPAEALRHSAQLEHGLRRGSRGTRRRSQGCGSGLVRLTDSDVLHSSP